MTPTTWGVTRRGPGWPPGGARWPTSCPWAQRTWRTTGEPSHKPRSSNFYSSPNFYWVECIYFIWIYLRIVAQTLIWGIKLILFLLSLNSRIIANILVVFTSMTLIEYQLDFIWHPLNSNSPDLSGLNNISFTFQFHEKKLDYFTQAL